MFTSIIFLLIYLVVNIIIYYICCMIKNDLYKLIKSLGFAILVFLCVKAILIAVAFIWFVRYVMSN